MSENKKGIEFIKTDRIYPHPENPRKELGDLTELTESLRKNGVMQNLTVIPIEGRPGEYYALIGNRRHGAAKLAGIEELPCRVVEGMDRKEQLSAMLEENMQRNDLTICEQAQGFQLMLDLGETEQTISEKTGFSRSTVRHRINIAKLNQAELAKKERDDCFQLTLKDLYELEKVKDVEKRNKILTDANNSRELANMAHAIVAEDRRKENGKAIAEMLEKVGIKKAPEGAENEKWSGKWEEIAEFKLDDEVPKEISLPEEKGGLMYVAWYRSVNVIRKAKKRELSGWEKEEKEKSNRKRQIKAVLKGSTVRRKELIMDIITGKIAPIKDEEKEKSMIWKALMALGAYESNYAIVQFFLSKDYYSSSQKEREAAERKASELCILHQMLITMHEAMARMNEPFDWKFHMIQSKSAALLKGYEALEPYGWYFESEDEKKVLDGTYELYAADDHKG